MIFWERNVPPRIQNSVTPPQHNNPACITRNLDIVPLIEHRDWEIAKVSFEETFPVRVIDEANWKVWEGACCDQGAWDIADVFS